MNVFVTGGTGFIGSYLVKRLVDMGHDVLCLKRKTSNLEKLDGYETKVEWIDIEDDWKERFVTFAPFIVYNLAWNGVSSADRVSGLWQMPKSAAYCHRKSRLREQLKLRRELNR